MCDKLELYSAEKDTGDSVCGGQYTSWEQKLPLYVHNFFSNPKLHEYPVLNGFPFRKMKGLFISTDFSPSLKKIFDLKPIYALIQLTVKLTLMAWKINIKLSGN